MFSVGPLFTEKTNAWLLSFVIRHTTGLRERFLYFKSRHLVNVYGFHIYKIVFNKRLSSLRMSLFVLLVAEKRVSVLSAQLALARREVIEIRH